VWLWWSGTDATAVDVDRLWQAFLRRFDIEHAFRLLKQTVGWTCPKIRTPQAADRWTWLLLAAYTQLRLTRRGCAPLSTRFLGRSGIEGRSEEHHGINVQAPGNGQDGEKRGIAAAVLDADEHPRGQT
jgi:hypothetical protein